MSARATTVVTGVAAGLVVMQADLIASHQGRDIYRLKTPDPRLGVFDSSLKRLVILDTAALASLIDLDERSRPPQLIDPTDPDAYMVGNVIDPPSRL